MQYEVEGHALLNMISALDKARYEVWALISSTRNFGEYIVAPFKLVWRFAGDRTVFCVVRTDVWPDVSTTDFVKWYCQEDICCFPCRIPWVDVLYALERRDEEIAVLGLTPIEPTNHRWNHLRAFVGFYLGRPTEHLSHLKL